MTQDLHELKRAHGGTVYDGGRRWIGPGPGHTRQDASLSVMVGDGDRLVLHSFAGDSFSACASHLGLERAAPMARADIERGRRDREAARRRRQSEDKGFCRAVWSGVKPVEGSPAEAYLWSRGLIYEGLDLAFHPAAPRARRPDAAQHPAMAALVRDVVGLPIGLHLTYLTAEGRKAFGDRSRLMFGSVAGGAVRLATVGPAGVLAVAEGIETAGGFSALHGVPTWAALSTSGLQTFAVPTGVSKLIIAADSDDAGAGLAAAHKLAELARRVCAVEIYPAPEGQDWADVAVAHG